MLVHTAHASEFDLVCDTLACGFFDDPLFRVMFPIRLDVSGRCLSSSPPMPDSLANMENSAFRRQYGGAGSLLAEPCPQRPAAAAARAPTPCPPAKLGDRYLDAHFGWRDAGPLSRFERGFELYPIWRESGLNLEPSKN
jgi:hypothetical protein